MRGVGAQLGQVCQVDVVFGARFRGHYGLKMRCLDWWNSFGVREGWTRWWLVPAKEGVVAQRSLCKGLSSRNAFGTQSFDASDTGDLCFPQRRSEQRSFERVRRVEVRSGCSYICGGPQDLKNLHSVTRSGKRGLRRR